MFYVIADVRFLDLRFVHSGVCRLEQKGVSLSTNPNKPDFSHISLNMIHTAQHIDIVICVHEAKPHFPTFDPHMMAWNFNGLANVINAHEATMQLQRLHCIPKISLFLHASLPTLTPTDTIHRHHDTSYHKVSHQTIRERQWHDIA